MDLVQVSA